MRAFRAFIVQELLLTLCCNLTSESNVLINMAANSAAAILLMHWHVGRIKMTVYVPGANVVASGQLRQHGNLCSGSWIVARRLVLA
jgi:hypothetical protein